MIIMQEIEPLALCMATQQLFDKRFRSNFGDNIILKDRDVELEPRLLKMKREMNSMMTEHKYLEGHKMNIVNNMDRILTLATRYISVDAGMVEKLVSDGKKIVKSVLAAESFDDIGRMEDVFKSQITLPIYDLHTRKLKQREQ